MRVLASDVPVNQRAAKISAGGDSRVCPSCRDEQVTKVSGKRHRSPDSANLPQKRKHTKAACHTNLLWPQLLSPLVLFSPPLLLSPLRSQPAHNVLHHHSSVFYRVMGSPPLLSPPCFQAHHY
ncbi:hypothetical protein ATANTOWER_016214 [Ataeniobius toweri]|uniref:Uncharacterized protein n=1 Tax=Ataeniobius toweri TaxID=208326 RepID=A0ABU7A7C5_9TELE|nr:hypothetical protein [Ataeniobius toweri]